MTHLRKFLDTGLDIWDQLAHLLWHLRQPRAVALRLLRVPCGAHGGMWTYSDGAAASYRWCWKPFGHCDSHVFEHHFGQPLERDRLRAQGHDA